MKLGKSGFAALAAVAALLSTPAQANCWHKDTIAAAKVREFETMLMVSALRCRNSGHDFLARYNHFVRQGRPVLTHANEKLRSHFIAIHGPGRGLNQYDGFVTSIANRYGAGTEGLSCRDLGDIVSAAIAGSHSLAHLERLADNAAIRPNTGRQCPVTMAAAR